ncbi:hypothetical protein EDD18DRAFT_1178260 [Armillaria luteobubalina]|uniref:Uncharacterized protein n=1 Tax=Armillaria luteobubalina TaxID=153913 RepID=A0AA39UM71_9AGAR|nr:hypothetical protein EDD18DRAFT_1178260 [Armillaria luteobubalina]
MGNIAIDSAYAAAYLSTFLFGAYVVVACHCSLVLYHRYKTKRLHRYLLGTHIALFLLITWRCTTTIARTLNGIIHLELHGGALNLYPPSFAWSLVENTPWVLVTVVADAFLVYRTYIVWMQKCLIIAIPLFLFAADIAMGIYFLVNLANPTTTFQELIHIDTAFAAVTLADNLICAALISFRIWRVRRNISVKRQGSDPLHGVIALIVESAAVYTVVLIAQIITLGFESRICFVLFDVQCPIIGIVFSMIIIRVSRGQSHGDGVEVNTIEMRWQHSTTEDTTANAETSGPHVFTDLRSEDVEAQHPDFRKVFTETTHESIEYKPSSTPNTQY